LLFYHWIVFIELFFILSLLLILSFLSQNQHNQQNDSSNNQHSSNWSQQSFKKSNVFQFIVHQTNKHNIIKVVQIEIQNKFNILSIFTNFKFEFWVYLPSAMILLFGWSINLKKIKSNLL
jgi:hypothetical protein